jgi:ribosomal protein S18 acetylase RimI-like enzyme
VAGIVASSAFAVRKSASAAQLRMLILPRQARGRGLGARLTDECIAFARGKGYKKMVLWTNSCRDSARATYAKRGIQLVKSEPYTGFGQKLVGETRALRLRVAPCRHCRLFGAACRGSRRRAGWL